MFVAIILSLYVLIGAALTLYAFTSCNYKKVLEQRMEESIKRNEKCRAWLNFYGKDFYWQCWLRVNIVIGVLLWPYTYIISTKN